MTVWSDFGLHPCGLLLFWRGIHWLPCLWKCHWGPDPVFPGTPCLGCVPGFSHGHHPCVRQLPGKFCCGLHPPCNQHSHCAPVAQEAPAIGVTLASHISNSSQDIWSRSCWCHVHHEQLQASLLFVNCASMHCLPLCYACIFGVHLL